MATRYFGAPIKRNEDTRLLTGQALFVDDVELTGLLHAAFLRAQVAHARIRNIDVSAARARDGVIAVYTADDLGDYWRHGPLLVPPPPIAGITFNERTQVPLAKDKIRHVGEPLAVVIAESRYIAEDALADIVVEVEQLPAVVDLEKALRQDASLVHDDVPANIAAHVRQTKGHYDKAAAQADHIIRRRLVYDRGASSPIETRGVVAQWDARGDQLTIWDTTQAPVFVRNGLAGMLGLSERQVRVIAPFVGGGFGPKIMMFYPEEVVIPWAAIKLGRPVKWIEDRLEHFFATTHERGQIHDAEMALTRDGRIVGVKDVFLHDTGAYDPYGLTVPINSQCTLLGPYVVPNYDSTFTAIFTNKPIVTPYRGAGRQHGVFVIERLLDIAARELGIDRAEIRRRNFIPADAFPYNNEIIYQDFAPLEYDSGNYEPILDKAMAIVDYDKFLTDEQPRRARARPLRRARHRGLRRGHRHRTLRRRPRPGAGERSRQRRDRYRHAGAGALHELRADRRRPGRRRGHRHRRGDRRHRPFSLGRRHVREPRRGGGGQCCQCGRRCRARENPAASPQSISNAPRTTSRSGDGQVSIKGIPDRVVRLGELAAKANPMRGAVRPGTEPGLEATRYFGPPRGATAAGVHAVIVEVDPETLIMEVLRYVVVHDCGTVINPLILAGQIHGGVAQGIGNAFYEQLVFDEEGQLLNASLADYLLPTALEVPRMELDHTVTPSPLNPLGIKGLGKPARFQPGRCSRRRSRTRSSCRVREWNCWRFRSARAGCGSWRSRTDDLRHRRERQDR